MDEFRISTRGKHDMVDVTRQVSEAVSRSGIADGLCTVFVPHTTAAITINENADPDVQKDIMAGTTRMVPNTLFRHSEGNSDGHIKSTLYGPSIGVIVKGGTLVLGTWQGIYLCEFDGPRERRLLVKVIQG
jgi:secondary thiamine-phosphate synthase enzyme